MNNWPYQTDCPAFYGDPRFNLTKWEHEHLDFVIPPFKMIYDHHIPIHVFQIHKKCKASLDRVLTEIWIAAHKEQAQIDEWGVSNYGGSMEFRMMRNGQHLSMHSYGCAIDLDPQHKTYGQSAIRFSKPVVKAFANEGWVNLLHDPMHFQAAIVG